MKVKGYKFNVKMLYAYNEGEGDGTGGASNAEVVTDPPATLETPPSFVPPPSAFVQGIPSEYHNEPYVQNLLQSENPEQELWKQFATLHQAVGTRPGGMPADDATAEDWQKWVSAVQPESISVYGDIKPTLGESQGHLQELIDASYTPTFSNTILEAVRANGIAPNQFKPVMEIFNNMQIEAAESFALQAQQQTQQMDLELDAAFTKEFGPDKTKVLDITKKFAQEHLSPEIQKGILARPNDELVALSAAIYKAHKVYGKEDSIPRVGSGSGYVANDEISLKAEISKAMAEHENAYSNTMSNQHQAQVHKVRQLSEQLSKLTNPNRGT